MKKLFLLLAACTFAFTACDNNKPEPEPDPIEVASVTVSPSTFELFTDEALPALTATVDPANAEDATVAWSSSNPEIIAVDAATGALSFAVTDIAEASAVVTITAKAGEKTGTSAITVKGQIAKYEVIDISAETGLLILDRNVGATAAFDGENAAAAIGNFYQWGNNTPVAVGEETAVNADFKLDWNAEGEGFVDWSNAANTPCPIGWGIPSDAQIDALTAITENGSWMMEEFGFIDEYEAAWALIDKMLTAPSGMFQVKDGAASPYMAGSPCFWSSFVDAETNPEGKLAWNYCESDGGMLEKNRFVNYAMPIRCVKDAPAAN
jgi:uncharacterized protein (TIGR02145 family)